MNIGAFYSQVVGPTDWECANFSSWVRSFVGLPRVRVMGAKHVSATREEPVLARCNADVIAIFVTGARQEDAQMRGPSLFGVRGDFFRFAEYCQGPAGP